MRRLLSSAFDGALVGLGGGAQNVSRQSVRNHSYACNLVRKLFKILKIYSNILRYSDYNVRAILDQKTALVLRDWRYLQFGVGKKNSIFKSSGGEPHSEY